MQEKTYPNITVVDEFDNLIGYMPLFTAIALEHIRRVVYVFAINSQNEVLIQRRGPGAINPCLLDASASGHVDEGDTYEAAAKRELSEEVGITNLPLQLLTEPFLTPGFYNAAFLVRVEDGVELAVSEELAETFWTPLSELDSDTVEHKDKFTPEFLNVWDKVRDKIII